MVWTSQPALPLKPRTTSNPTQKNYKQTANERKEQEDNAAFEGIKSTLNAVPVCKTRQS